MQLATYTSESVKVLCSISIKVCHSSQEKCLPILAVSGDGLSLLERNWLNQSKLVWILVFYLQSDTELVKVLADHKDIFNDELDTLHDTVVKLHIDSQSVPRICNAIQA